MAFAPGTRLGLYEVIAQIGAGGMGEVYSALDTRLGRHVAIKVLPSFVTIDSDRLRRFELEARATATLNHPNIMAVFQLGTHEGVPYLVSELLDGSTLRGQLKRGPMPLRKVIDCGVQVVRGLAAAHEKGIVHRDLKPENLFVTKDGRVKILDFGLARVAEPSWAGHGAATVTAQTEPGALVGTIGYMAPEQVSGSVADYRADIFSFGAVLYEMLTGQRAFHKTTAAETMTAILREDPPRVSLVTPAVPPALQKVVERCLEKRPEQRFQSASDLAFALEALSDADSGAVPAVQAGSRRRWQWAATAVVLIALGAAVGGYVFFHRPPTFTEKDAIVLADFTNTTGDPVFDGTLRQGLSVQLEQTPFLRIVSSDQIAHSLRLMEKPPDTPLTHEVAREVCLRAGATVEIDGSIAALGHQYVLGLTALNCNTGDTLAHEQATAKDKENVLATLTTASSQLRSKLGESAASLTRYDVPLPEASTPSLEALQAFSRAGSEFNAFKFPSAVAQYERAISLDPNFAAAYGVLGTLRGFLGNTRGAAEDVNKAYALRASATEFERLFLTANYHLWVTGDLEQAIQADQVWVRTFPNNEATHQHLSYVYRLLGRNNEALAVALEALRLDPASAPSYTTPFAVYLRQGKLDKLSATLHEAEARHLDEPYVYLLYYAAFLRHDEAGMAEQAKRLDAGGFVNDTFWSAYKGRHARWHDLTKRKIEVFTQAHEAERIAATQAGAVLIDALFGYQADAKRAALEIDWSTAGWDAQANATLALALAGDTTRARAMADDLNQRFPSRTFIQFYYLPAIGAALALQQEKPEDAIDRLRAAVSYDLAANETAAVGSVGIPLYVRGQAFLAAHQGAQAVAEFQKIVDNPGTVLDFPVGALAHLGLGRAYVLAGDLAKARAAYQEFLTLWKDADPDVPILIQAKAEYAKLN